MSLENLDANKAFTSINLYKYIDLHKLLSLVYNKTLIFTRLDFYEDPYEGVSFKTLTEYQTYKEEPTNSSLENLAELQETFRKRKTEFENKIAIQQGSQFSNSWFLSDDESLAMWNLYSNRDSVCIRVNIDKFITGLERALNNYKESHQYYKFICGKVSYNRLNPWNPFKEDYSLRKYSGFKKDIVFSHENEWRTLIAIPEQSDLIYPENLIVKYDNILDIIEEIITHPQMESWKYKNIEMLLDSHEIKNKLKKSRVYLKR